MLFKSSGAKPGRKKDVAASRSLSRTGFRTAAGTSYGRPTAQTDFILLRAILYENGYPLLLLSVCMCNRLDLPEVLVGQVKLLCDVCFLLGCVLSGHCCMHRPLRMEMRFIF